MLKRLALLEHPAQHFASETGDFDLVAFNNNLACQCGDSQSMRRQTVYVQNQLMAEAARQFDVPVIHLWEHSLSQCKAHEPPDCTHYPWHTSTISDWNAFGGNLF